LARVFRASFFEFRDLKNTTLGIPEMVMIKMTVNGKPVEVKLHSTLTEILKFQDVESPETVSVELNREIIPRREYDSTYLKENDRLEFLYFMGGGRFK